MTPVLWTICAGLSFLFAFVFSGFLSRKRDFLPDIPNQRSSHTRTTPRGGALSFLPPFFAATVFGADGALPYLLSASFACALVGLVDDARGLPVRPRLASQLIIASLFCLGAAPPEFTLPGVAYVTGWSARFIQVLWLVLCVNFFNFMDGLDGLAGLQALFTSTLLALVLSHIGGFSPLSQGFVLLAFALCGFLVRNLLQSRLFMGDAGSYFLGFLFGGAGLLSRSAEPSLADLTTVVTILLLPFLLDAGVTLVKRSIRRENLFHAHRDHLYQWLNRAGLSPLQVGLFFLMWNALSLPLLSLLFQKAPNSQVAAGLGLYTLAFLTAHLILEKECRRRI